MSINNSNLYFLSRDNDSHWYIVAESHRSDWFRWLDSDSDDVPVYATPVGGSPSDVVFRYSHRSRK